MSNPWPFVAWLAAFVCTARRTRLPGRRCRLRSTGRDTDSEPICRPRPRRGTAANVPGAELVELLEPDVHGPHPGARHRLLRDHHAADRQL